MKIQEWTFDEVSQVLDDKRAASEVAKDMRNRSTGAVYSLRNLANQYQKGKGSYITRNMREHLHKYFVNKGNMNLEPMQQKEQENTPEMKWRADSQVDTCEKQMEEIVVSAEKQFESLKELMAQLARTTTTHENHKIMQELSELKEWKKTTEPELSELREFKKTAQSSNFASVLRKTTRMMHR
jgi:hypothetical protein